MHPACLPDAGRGTGSGVCSGKPGYRGNPDRRLRRWAFGATYPPYAMVTMVNYGLSIPHLLMALGYGARAALSGPASPAALAAG